MGFVPSSYAESRKNRLLQIPHQTQENSINTLSQGITSTLATTLAPEDENGIVNNIVNGLDVGSPISDNALNFEVPPGE